MLYEDSRIVVMMMRAALAVSFELLERHAAMTSSHKSAAKCTEMLGGLA